MRLRYLEDEMPDFVGDAAQLMLRVKVKEDSLEIVKMLQDTKILHNENESLCFNFDFSFYAHEELE